MYIGRTPELCLIRKGGKRLEQSDGSCTVYFPRFMPFNLYLERAEAGDLDVRMNNLNNFYYWCATRLLTLDRKYAKEINWDWRLLASLAYTESNFDTTAVSWAGAKGLMQLMPRTARAMGVPEGMEQNPEESIKGAVKYIGLTTGTFSGIPQPERMKFILAAYNSGNGHILDAMALAEKYGANKHVWDDNVEKYILLKSNEEYFSDPVCKHGYFRGIETYNFVREIIQRYNRYKEVIKE